MKLRREPYKSHWRALNPDTGIAMRPNKNSLGASYTASRSHHPIQLPDGKLRPAILVRLHGSMDRLAGGIKRRYKIINVTRLRLQKNKGRHP